MTADRAAALRCVFANGEHHGLAGPAGLALVDGEAEIGFVDQLWQQMRDGATSREVTEYLVAHGLAGLPSFALVMLDRAEGSLVARVIVRGSLGAALTGVDGGVEIVDPGDAITWVERSVGDPGEVWLGHLPAPEPPSAGHPFQISLGRVPAAWISMDCASNEEPRFDTPGPAASGAPQSSMVPPPPTVDLPPPTEAETPAESDQSPAAAGDHDVPLAVARDAPASVAQDVPAAGDQDVPTTGDHDDDESDRPAPEGPRSSSETVTFTSDLDLPAEAEPRDPIEQVSTGATDETVAPPEPGEDEDDDGLDGLFGMTEHRPVSSAGVEEPDSEGTGHANGLISAVPPESVAEAAEAASQDVTPDIGDHDGMTISLSQLRAQQAAAGNAGGEGDAVAPTGVAGVDQAELVHAVSCPVGHLNPPLAASCRVCGVEVPAQDYESVPRPTLGILRFSDGTDRPLTRSMLLGRSPKAAGSLTGEQLPELVTLESPTRELSGTHLEVRLEGWQVLVIDRRSTNGTTVQLPGRDPQRLHPGNAVPIVPGTLIDMAEEVQFTYEVET